MRGGKQRRISMPPAAPGENDSLLGQTQNRGERGKGRGLMTEGPPPNGVYEYLTSVETKFCKETCVRR